MNHLPQMASLQPDLSGRAMTLNLVLRGAEGITIRSCEILARGFRNRTSFLGRMDVNDILAAPLARAVYKSVANVPEGKQVLALPEFLVELPGLALSGLHVLIMEAKDGIRSAIFRFQEFVGAFNNAFCEDIGFNEPMTTLGDRLAANVLSDICLPLLNLCREMEFESARTQKLLPARIAERAQELEFQTELLKRFIFNASGGHAPAPLDHMNRMAGRDGIAQLR